MKFIKNELIGSNTLQIKNSISNKVARSVSILIAITVVVLISVVTLLVHRDVSQQTQKMLTQDAQSAQKHLEQRIGYLVDSVILLTHNELVVNALVDVQGRDAYLPELIDNFKKNYMHFSIISLKIYQN